jgi:hypothetical protein
MITAWEYTRVWLMVQERRDRQGADEFKDMADAKWAGKLNEMGAAGWELVSESVIPGGAPGSESWSFEFNGTMKRPGAASISN